MLQRFLTRLIEPDPHPLELTPQKATGPDSPTIAAVPASPPLALEAPQPVLAEEVRAGEAPTASQARELGALVGLGYLALAFFPYWGVTVPNDFVPMPPRALKAFAFLLWIQLVCLLPYTLVALFIKKERRNAVQSGDRLSPFFLASVVVGRSA